MHSNRIIRSVAFKLWFGNDIMHAGLHCRRAQNDCSRFLEPVTGCTCVGDLLVYECSAFGPGTTLWEGSAFRTDCTGSIILRHSQFSTSQGARDSCNSGGIVGKSVNVVDQCYTSQLNVTIDSSLNGATVSCIHVSNGERRKIGNNTITITAGETLYNLLQALIFSLVPRPMRMRLWRLISVSIMRDTI